jgi:hypothetical protein
MAVTTTKASTLQTELDKANVNSLADVLKLMKLGTMLTPLKVSVTGYNATSAINLTKLGYASGGAVTIIQPVASGGLPMLPPGGNLPPLLQCLSLRVTGATGTTGVATGGARLLTDAAGTAGAPGVNGPGIALISDDGTTITFDGAVAGFVIEYMPQAAIPMGTLYPAVS